MKRSIFLILTVNLFMPIFSDQIFYGASLSQIGQPVFTEGSLAEWDTLRLDFKLAADDVSQVLGLFTGLYELELGDFPGMYVSAFNVEKNGGAYKVSITARGVLNYQSGSEARKRSEFTYYESFFGSGLVYDTATRNFIDLRAPLPQVTERYFSDQRPQLAEVYTARAPDQQPLAPPAPNSRGFSQSGIFNAVNGWMLFNRAAEKFGDLWLYEDVYRFYYERLPSDTVTGVPIGTGGSTIEGDGSFGPPISANIIDFPGASTNDPAAGGMDASSRPTDTPFAGEVREEFFGTAVRDIVLPRYDLGSGDYVFGVKQDGSQQAPNGRELLSARASFSLNGTVYVVNSSPVNDLEEVWSVFSPENELWEFSLIDPLPFLEQLGVWNFEVVYFLRNLATNTQEEFRQSGRLEVVEIFEETGELSVRDLPTFAANQTTNPWPGYTFQRDSTTLRSDLTWESARLVFVSGLSSRPDIVYNTGDFAEFSPAAGRVRTGSESQATTEFRNGDYSYTLTISGRVNDAAPLESVVVEQGTFRYAL